MITTLQKVVSQSSMRDLRAAITSGVAPTPATTPGVAPTPANRNIKYEIAGTTSFELAPGPKSYFIHPAVEAWSWGPSMHTDMKSKIYLLFLGILGLFGIMLAILGFASAVVVPGSVYFSAAPVGLALVAAVGYLARFHERDTSGRP